LYNAIAGEYLIRPELTPWFASTVWEFPESRTVWQPLKMEIMMREQTLRIAACSFLVNDIEISQWRNRHGEIRVCHREENAIVTLPCL
jgi:hypothetical protein